MSELINTQNTRGEFRWQLLTTVSVLAFSGVLYAGDAAQAGDADRPTVWIELGGQLERVQGMQDAFVPPFLETQPRPGFETTTPASTQRPARFAIGGEAKVTIAPKGTDWSFLGQVRFGRSNSSKHDHMQTTAFKKTGLGTNATGAHVPFYAPLTQYGDTVAANAERHLIVDFMAGKDVGLGLGHNATATFDFGVRFAQFTSKSTVTIQNRENPTILRVPAPPNPFLPNLLKYNTTLTHQTYYAHSNITRSFSGVGPSLSLTGSSPVLGNQEDVQIAFDWGANAAVLFGRQKVRGNFATKGSLFTGFNYAPKSGYSHAAPVARSRSTIVPNVGGFAGLTFRHADAKVSFGYRADFFFGAMDAGVAARDSSTVSFHGPFATISIGLGG